MAAVKKHWRPNRVARHKTEAIFLRHRARSSHSCSQRNLQRDGAQIFRRQLEVSFSGFGRAVAENVANRLQRNRGSQQFHGSRIAESVWTMFAFSLDASALQSAIHHGSQTRTAHKPTRRS